MRQWEDMRDTTGVMDFFAELTMDVDDIRDDANRLHDAAGGDFHLAKITEHEAREICVHELKQAYDLLPDFRMGFIQRVDVVSAIAELRREAAEVSTNPLTQLPGSGPKQDYYPIAGDDIVSPTDPAGHPPPDRQPPRRRGQLLESTVHRTGPRRLDSGEQGDHQGRGTEFGATAGHGRRYRVAGGRRTARHLGRHDRHHPRTGGLPLEPDRS
jgi:hypothetical protein